RRRNGRGAERCPWLSASGSPRFSTMVSAVSAAPSGGPGDATNARAVLAREDRELDEFAFEFESGADDPGSAKPNVSSGAGRRPQRHSRSIDGLEERTDTRRVERRRVDVLERVEHVSTPDLRPQIYERVGTGHPVETRRLADGEHRPRLTRD